MAVVLNTAFLEGFLEKSDFQKLNTPVKEAHDALYCGTAAGSDFTGWLKLPAEYDRAEFLRIQKAAEKIRSDSEVLVVVGIGGSYLGARAVIELLGSEFYNDFAPLKVLYAGNNISGDYLNSVIRLLSGKRFSINVVSKSGTTLEPALAFRLLKAILEKQCGEKGAAERIYVTTDKVRGALKNLADAKGYQTFVIPDEVGGRFSVLTAVGLLPIAAAGFDIGALMAGAARGMERFQNPELSDNDCYTYAAARYLLMKKDKQVEVLSCYEPAFKMFGEWYKQLYGESEGKDGKGIFPASLLFSADLHSMGQYVQDGQRILFETVVRFKKAASDLSILSDPTDFDGLNYVAGRPVSEINKIASDGVLLAHTGGGVPNLLIEADAIDEENVGELIYFFEKACAISGALLGVNPFDQPGVESYKKNMFALLGKPGFEAEGEKLRNKLR